MGAAAVVAALAGRPSSRWYALLLAAVVTLALNPRAAGDVGWQLSFAAVLGILLAAGPIRRALAGPASGPRAALAEGAALTLAATLATTPLMAYHFGAVSLVAVPANLLALPAVAPLMWLGMLAAAAQLPALPLEPLVWSAGVLAGYVAQVAAWFAAPAWASVEAEIGGPGQLLAAYGLGVAFAIALSRGARRRRGLGIAPATGRIAGALAVLATLAVGATLAGAVPQAPGPAAGLRIRFLDVGQGDAILLEPRGRDPVLIDGGPAGADVSGHLAAEGIERLAAVIATHPEADHIGGLPGVLERIPTGAYGFVLRDRATLAAARDGGAEPLPLAAGDVVRVGRLRLEVLWPPAERLEAWRRAAGGANSLALVVRASWGAFDALLTADAEAELAPVDPGRIELLKVAHHGSADAGLTALLDRAGPAIAVISVGERNPYGHPAPSTTAALAEAGIEVLRTDLDGEVRVEVSGGRWSVR
jgi:competence protein ComEC